MNMTRILLASLLACIAPASPAQTGPVKFAGIMELSGSGATPGTNFNNGAKRRRPSTKRPTWCSGRCIRVRCW